MKKNQKRIHQLANAGVQLTDDHTYIAPNGDAMKRSVTNLVAEQFEEFDAPEVASQIESRCYYSHISRYRGMQVDQILNLWEHIRDEGTRIHKEIETELSSGKETTDPRARYGIDWVKEYFSDCVLFPEVKVWNGEWSIGGTIDLIAVNADDEVHIADWKCGWSEPTDDYRRYGTTSAFKHVPDSKIAKYSSQLSMYSLLLKQFGIKTKWRNRYIVWLGPKGAESQWADDYRKEMLKAVRNINY